MPIYDYKCGVCGHEFEAVVFKDPALYGKESGCPKCGSSSVSPQTVYKFRVSFTGPGWPGNDIKNEGRKNKRKSS